MTTHHIHRLLVAGCAALLLSITGPVLTGQAAEEKAYPDAVFHPVRSEILESVMYESTTRVLTIRFPSGGLTEYYDVPRELFVGLIESRMAGGFFRSKIEGKFASSPLSR